MDKRRTLAFIAQQSGVKWARARTGKLKRNSAKSERFDLVESSIVVVVVLVVSRPLD